MKRIAAFQKVSASVFAEACRKIYGIADETAISNSFQHLCIPERATAHSAGYDFRLPFDLRLVPGESILIPTGIRAKMEEGWVLLIFPRSGLGFKYRLQLDNTVGVIDGDYYNSDNEGHIMVRLTNDGHEGKTLELKAGAAFAQGVFVPYGITLSDAAAGVRNGGLGSTGT